MIEPLMSEGDELIIQREPLFGEEPEEKAI
jgi:hypothetical protein